MLNQWMKYYNPLETEEPENKDEQEDRDGKETSEKFIAIESKGRKKFEGKFC